MSRNSACCGRVYFCPQSGERECPVHGGFDVCCDRPELHREVVVEASLEQVMATANRLIRKWRTTLDYLAGR